MANREERLLMRMRGAARHQVEDVPFDFIIPFEPEPEVQQEPAPAPALIPEPAPPPASAPAPEPESRRQPVEDAARHATETPLRSGAAHSTSHSSPQVTQVTRVPVTTERPTTARRKPTGLSSGIKRVSLAERNDHDEDNDHEMGGQQPQQQQQPLHQPQLLQALPIPVPDSGNRERLSSQLERVSLSAVSPIDAIMSEEVSESPADAPGSGRRQRTARLGDITPVVGSSTLLRRVLDDLDETSDLEPSSSPLERRATRKSDELRLASSRSAAPPQPSPLRRTRRSPRLSGGSNSSVVDGSRKGGSVVDATETTIHEPEGAAEVEESVLESPDRVDGGDDQPLSDVGDDEPGVEAVEQNEEAQEIDEQEAARRLGRKRPRRESIHEQSSLKQVGGSVPIVEEQPVAKRRRRREPAAASPAQQQQPKKVIRGNKPAEKPAEKSTAKPVTKPQAKSQAKPSPKIAKKQVPNNKTNTKKTRKKSRVGNDANDNEEEANAGSVPITVQRFTKTLQFGDEPDASALSAEIPFANRGGVNAVDVLSKLCDELIEAFLAKLVERARTAEDAASKREQRTMARALEAFQEELRTRLLEHTIALDTLHAIRKRVRVAQKEKLSLREEILRVRAEREQVALRMDAIRIKHEADSKEALRHISFSSAMHDIDMAVEKGQAAPELSAAEQKRAGLANLELLISRVSDQVCTRSDGGGTLKQIRDFNALLERAATVLEGR
ncbi:hypothetical protein B0T17DRAFT_538188 [Bombardia bombarda]|uniref:Inner kinetochore subunit AME1 domain-containing protein n=1 Tax=Bombardia bombarda TaxID=252184 RepID=A0AA39WN88_9PEZI|nr:hypothetical protein B0T17DRAFT_538188 [Bombardia bombarda]